MATEIKAYSKAEIAQLYHVRVEQFMKWIAQENELKEVYKKYYFKKIFTPKAVEKIFNVLGNP